MLFCALRRLVLESVFFFRRFAVIRSSGYARAFRTERFFFSCPRRASFRASIFWRVLLHHLHLLRRTKSGILGAPPKDEFWGSWDPAGSKEHQILHYMVKSRLPENSVRSIYEKLRFLRPLRGPLEAQGTAGSPGRRGSQGGRGAVRVPKNVGKNIKN